MAITPEQCRAARGLLNWSQQKLAEAATVTQETVANFEVGARKSYPRTLAAIEAALENAGVIFIAGTATTGPGVCLRDPQKK